MLSVMTTLVSDSDFEDAYSQVQTCTLLTREKSEILWICTDARRHLPGEVWECGVYRGGSAFLLSKAKGKQQTLRLFDTFTGLPLAEEIDFHQAGEFSADIDEALKWFPRNGIRLHQGLIPLTMKGLNAPIAIAHLDLDLYRSTADAIDAIWPLLLPGGCLVIDDYAWDQCPGVTKAVNERFSPEQLRFRGLPQVVVEKPC